MRTLVLIFVTLAALVGGFLVYAKLQPAVVATAPGSPGPAVGQVSAPGANPNFYGPGKGAWLQQYDARGDRTYRFRADRYDFQNSGGNVHVLSPAAEFFLGQGRILRIDGENGDVQTTSVTAPDRAVVGGGNTMDAPRSGLLRHVTVRLYASEQLQRRAEAEHDPDGYADLTLRMNNVFFDNDVYRLYTQGYTDEQGNVVRDDEVPVTLTGKDYDFDGRGLIVYWNDRDRQLKSLEIVHGHSLLIKHMAALGTPGAEGGGGGARSPVGLMRNDVRLASADPAAAGQALATAPAERGDYRASFFDAVHVLQGGKDLLDGDVLNVDFASKEQATTTPPSAPTAAPPPPAPVAATPAAEPPTAPPPSPATSQPVAAGPAPTTKPAEQPVEVRWTGKLLVLPRDEGSPLPPGQAVVTMVGAPARFHQAPSTDGAGRGVDVTCAALGYRTADASVHLEADAVTPLLITERRAGGAGTTVSSRSLDFSRKTHVAVLTGKGNAKFPDPNDPQSILSAAWDERCTLHLSNEAPPGADAAMDATTGAMNIERADLDGNVVVDHPKLNLVAQALTLLFDPARPPTGAKAKGTPSAELRELIATGAAKCRVREADGRVRSIAGDRVNLKTGRTAAGKTYPQTLLADGKVVASDGQQELRSGHLNVAMLPAPPKAGPHADATTKASDDPLASADVQLDTLVATDDVMVLGKDGASAGGSELRVVQRDGHPQITLVGSPATLIDKETTWTGPELHLSPDDSYATADGPGVLKTVQRPQGGGDPRPLEVWWEQRAVIDGKNNEIRLLKNVEVRSPDKNGTQNTTKSDRLALMLEDAPTTRPVGDGSSPAKPPAAPAPPAASRPQPSDDLLAGSKFNFMNGKQVRSISLLDHAEIQSTLTDAAGAILRRFDIMGPQIDYAVEGRTLTVPVPGRMLVEDHRPASTQPSATNPNTPGGRGTSVFAWSKRFTYDEPNRRARLEGSVQVVHKDDGPDAGRIRMTSDTVTATFADTAAKGTKPAAAAPTAAPGLTAAPAATQPQPGDDVSRLQLQHVLAEGSVKIQVEAKNTTIECNTVDYDPAGELLIARGEDRSPVLVTYGADNSTANFREVWFNTRTNQIEKMIDLNVRGGRR